MALVGHGEISAKRPACDIRSSLWVTTHLCLSYLDVVCYLAHSSIMPIPTPNLKSAGSQALQDYLDKVVKDGEVPAVSLGVTNKDGELWFGCGGDRIFGQPDEGQITPDTSELQ